MSKSLMTWDVGKVFEVAFSDILMGRKFESWGKAVFFYLRLAVSVA